MNVVRGQNTVTIQSTGQDSTHLLIERGNLLVNGEISASRGLVLSNSSAAKAGAIKFENGEFYGYDGSTWLPLSTNREKAILGPSSLVFDGSFSFNSLTGLQAADAICKSAYPNEPSAHFYNDSEVNEAMTNNKMGSLVQNVKYWVMSSNYRFGNGTNVYEVNSNFNNCFNYLSSSGALNERGTVFSYIIAAPYSGQLVGINGSFKNNEVCASNYSLVCGR
jgi:hypothetical protein